ncbi:hypothetical protein LUZ63_016233 [Rhynchospora breviuscula]|uniref:UspA domain-containing protein n=1 Tax=Rhynchospora breviuscula TaxID=2022672 RepID=A0A9Q0C138_9POAL|nr:hypothetical protein LUZ63_016233 [Rhynchospora breviuscula]
MERQRVVVMVEEAEASRAALEWAIRNYIRCGDGITLLYVCPPSALVRSRKKRRSLRLRGFHLALSFRDLCNGIDVEIVVTEGEQADTIISTVNQVGATTLILGLHQGSFLFNCRAMNQFSNRRNLKCRVLAIKHHSMPHDAPFLNLQLSQVETIHLCAPAAEAKVPFPIFTLPLGALCGKSKRQKNEVNKIKRRKYVVL